LAAGEKGLETDTGKEKNGDGATAWTSLPYVGGGSPIVASVTQSATPAINTDHMSVASILSLTQNITSMTSGLTGTPVDGQSLTVRITNAGAAPTVLVASTIAKGSSSVTTAAINTTGASFLVAALASYASGTSQIVSDSKGNSWTVLQDYGANAEVQLFYCSHPTVGTGHTFTSACVAPALAVAAFSGMLDSGTVDMTTTGAGATQPGSGTPGHSGDVIFTAAASNTDSGTWAVDQGFTIAQQCAGTTGASEGVALAYLHQTTAAALNPTWSGMTGYATTMAAFQAVAAGASGPFTIAWGSAFEASGVSLPTSTLSGTTAALMVGFVYNALTSAWRCVSVA
jgi:hypothetical protein